MKNHIFFIYTFLLIKIILSGVYKLKTIPVKKISLYRNNRLLDNKEEDDSFIEKVYGNSYSLYYYYATLYLGPNKIPQTYILGTDSALTTSPCNKCESCENHLNKPYEIDDSNIIKCPTKECNSVQSHICRNNQCYFFTKYLEGSSLEGIFTMQEIYFEQINKNPNITSKSYKIPIGCTTKETNLFINQLADGILGLNNNNKSFISLLYNNNIISKNIFSICFGQDDGYFSIGEIDTTYHKSNIEYVPLINNRHNRHNYYINLTKIQIGDEIINNDYEVSLNSGTTLTSFPYSIYNSIINKFNIFCEKKECGNFKNRTYFGYCGVFISNEEKEKAINEYWPNITLHFEEVKYVLTPKDYYFEVSDKYACLGFEGDKSNRITFGNTFMHGHDIIFDRGNKRIGFAVADCNRGISINDNINNRISNNGIHVYEKTYIEERYNKDSKNKIEENKDI